MEINIKNCMEYDLNKCPECGYVNNNRPDICPSCGFNLYDYRDKVIKERNKLEEAKKAKEKADEAERQRKEEAKINNYEEKLEKVIFPSYFSSKKIHKLYITPLCAANSIFKRFCLRYKYNDSYKCIYDSNFTKLYHQAKKLNKINISPAIFVVDEKGDSINNIDNTKILGETVFYNNGILYGNIVSCLKRKEEYIKFNKIISKMANQLEENK